MNKDLKINLGGVINLDGFVDVSMSNLDWLDVDPESYREHTQLPRQNDVVDQLSGLWNGPDASHAPPVNTSILYAPPAGRTAGFNPEAVFKYTRLSIAAGHKGADLYNRIASIINQFAPDFVSSHSRIASTPHDEKYTAFKDTLSNIIASELGLLGKLYLYASDFSKCESGEIFKFSKSVGIKATRLLAKDKCTDCIFKQNNKCNPSGMSLHSSLSLDNQLLSELGVSNPVSDIRAAIVSHLDPAPVVKTSHTPFLINKPVSISAAQADEFLDSIEAPQAVKNSDNDRLTTVLYQKACLGSIPIKGEYNKVAYELDSLHIHHMIGSQSFKDCTSAAHSLRNSKNFAPFIAKSICKCGDVAVCNKTNLYIHDDKTQPYPDSFEAVRTTIDAAINHGYKSEQLGKKAASLLGITKFTSLQILSKFLSVAESIKAQKFASPEIINTPVTLTEADRVIESSLESIDNNNTRAHQVFVSKINEPVISYATMLSARGISVSDGLNKTASKFPDRDTDSILKESRILEDWGIIGKHYVHSRNSASECKRTNDFLTKTGSAAIVTVVASEACGGCVLNRVGTCSAFRAKLSSTPYTPEVLGVISSDVKSVKASRVASVDAGPSIEGAIKTFVTRNDPAPRQTPISLNSGVAFSGVTNTKKVISAADVSSTVTKVRVAINNGLHGHALMEFISKLDKDVVVAAKSDILPLVKLSGNLGVNYIDPAAYPDYGVCKVGPAQHQNRKALLVLEQEKCTGCTMKNALGDCTRYNRRLVSEPSARTNESITVQSAPILNPVHAFDLQSTLSIELNQEVNTLPLEIKMRGNTM